MLFTCKDINVMFSSIMSISINYVKIDIYIFDEVKTVF